MRDIVEGELDDSLENLFQVFHPSSLATASIGQVHAAQLFTGEEVVVKVQRPDIQPTIETDLEILHDLAREMEKRIKWAKTYRIRDIIAELTKSLRDELDYEIEGRNGERLAAQFENQPAVHIPRFYWKLITKKILTMEKVNGIKVSSIEELDEQGYDRKEIAERLADSMFYQILDGGFFHGDPHPGNISILPDNVVSYLDFGMMGELNAQLKYNVTTLFIQLQRGSAKGIINALSAMDLLGEDTNIDAFEKDLNQLIKRYYDISLKEISMGEVITDILATAYGHQVMIPPDVTLLTKSILTMEETIKTLDPEFSVMKAVEPFGKKLFRTRYHPKNILHQSLNDIVENIETLWELPKDLKEITTTMKKGRLRFDINVKELQTFLQRLDKISNRISFSIILLSFSILMVGLIIGSAIADQTTLLFRLPVIEIGAVIATLMFLFMIYSIIKSGRM